MICADRTAIAQLVLATRSRDHCDPEALRILNGKRADAARAAMHEKPVSVGKTDQLDIGVDGCCDLDDGGRRDQLHPKRRWHDLTGGHRNVLRIAAACQESDAGILQLPIGNLRSYLCDRPGHLESEDGADIMRLPVMPLPL